MYSSSNTNLDRCSAGHLHSLPHDCALFQVSDAVLSKKNDGSKNDGSKTRSVERVEYSPRLVSSSQTGLSSNPSQAVSVESLPGGTCLSPIAGAYGAHEQPLKGGVHQAKRTRVENIIRDMTGSSHEQLTHTAIEEGHKAELNSIPERHRSPESPRDRVNTQRGGAGNSGDRSSEDLTKMKKLPRKFKPLRKLQIGLTHGGWRRESEGTGEKCAVEDYPTRSDSHSNDDFNERKKLRLINNPQSKPDKVNAFLADILKYELSRAVNTSVDSIFKGMPLLERSSVVDRSAGTEIRNPSPLKTQPSPVHEDTKSAFSQYADEILEFHIPEVQTEALSLVVHRPLQSTTCAPNTLPGTKNCHHHNPEPLFPSSHQAAPHERRASEYIPSTSRLNNLRRLKDARCHGVEAAKLEALDPSWDSTKARSKVTSRSIRGSQTQRVAEPVLLESLCLPHVKTESDGLQSLGRNNMFVLNEGLTTNHLKKAKLMFFYTRYPSSLVLKTFFHDVQFTRCITSQLIKWFSNFREFYYIQMEKYARHNVTEGEAGVRDLTVGRESELFRTLNMHYNKANDFQVPERFLEVAEITLREFYIAISVGKDSDPSWKKPIYKVICKLDSEVPNEFKTHSSE